MIELETHDAVHVLHLRAGENRFNRTTVDAILGALDEVAAVEGPAALVTVGEGKFFSNGLDLEWMGGDGAGDTGFLDDVHTMLERVLLADVVTVAAINGHAFAGGAMLAAAHDFRVMRSDRGYWCLPEVDLGLPLTPTMFRVLDAHLPRATLAEASLTGRRYDAEAALDAGIATSIAPEDDVLDQAVAIAAAAAKDRRVIAAHKALLYGAPGD